MNIGKKMIFSLSFLSISASAYDANDWINACDVTDPKIQKIMESEVSLVQYSSNPSTATPGQLYRKADGHYAVVPDTYTYVYTICSDYSLGCHQPLMPESIFYGEPKATGRSGFLIAPNVVITSPHVNPFNLSLFKIVVGLKSKKNSSGICEQSSYADILPENVFDPAPSTPQTPYINTYQSPTGPDYYLFYLSRSTNLQPPYLKLRRSGYADIGDRAVDVSHPERLSAKVTTDAEFFGLNASGLLMNGGHGLDGSSGGLIYNYDYDYVEAANSWGTGCANYSMAEDSSQPIILNLFCPDHPYAVNRPVSEVADSFGLPSYSLTAYPEGRQTYVLPESQQVVTANYQLKAPTAASISTPSSWQISMPGSASGISSTILSPSASTGQLGVGQSYSFSVSTTTTGSCGTYDQDILVTDITAARAERLVNTYEVGLREFRVSDDLGFDVEGMLAPTQPLSKVYSLTNLRPTPVTIKIDYPEWALGTKPQLIARGGGWGGNGPPSVAPLQLTLTASGTPRSTANFTISANPATVASLPKEGAKFGDIIFSPVGFSECTITDPIARGAAINVGTQTYKTLFPAFPDIPPPAPGSVFGTPLTGVIHVGEDFVIDGISVDTGLYNVPITQAAWDSSYLKIEVVPPGHQPINLWDRDGIPDGYWKNNAFSSDFNDSLMYLHVDDGDVRPHDLIGLRSLRGTSAIGDWMFNIYSSNVGVSTYLGEFRIKFWGHPQGGECGASCVASRIWQSRQSVNTFPRTGPSLVMLPNRKVLMVGGYKTSPTLTSSHDVEVYDPDSDKWLNVAPTLVSRGQSAAVVLKSGKVLVVGGGDSGSLQTLQSAEIYNPAGNQWSMTSPPLAIHGTPTATLLPNGKVLVVGRDVYYSPINSELYDENSDTWVTTQYANYSRIFQSATLLGDGRVLVIGGAVNGSPTKTAEIYNPMANTWTNVTSMAYARYGHTATLIPSSGKVVVVGGYGVSGNMSSVEIYDPSTNLWSTVTSLSLGRSFHSATLLPSEKIIIAGGAYGSSSSPTADVELFDPSTMQFSVMDTLNVPRSSHGSILLDTGNIFIVGGIQPGNTLGSTEIFN